MPFGGSDGGAVRGHGGDFVAAIRSGDIGRGGGGRGNRRPGNRGRGGGSRCPAAHGLGEARGLQGGPFRGRAVPQAMTVW